MKSFRWLRARLARHSLALQLLVILSVAVLPLGLISVYQTSKVLRETRALSEIALLDQTRTAAAPEQELILSAFGAVEALRATVQVSLDTPAECDRVMTQMVQSDPRYVFAGFATSEGQVACASTQAHPNLKDTAFFTNLGNANGRFVDAQPLDFLEDGDVINVSVPVTTGDALSGYLWISIPRDLASDLLLDGTHKTDFLVFNTNGDILTAETPAKDAQSILPQEHSLKSLTTGAFQTFRATDQTGEVRDFAIAPLVPETAFVLGSWEPQAHNNVTGGGEFVAVYFPLLMWIAAMLVGYIGINRLVIRHIVKLRGWMRLYADGQTDFSNAKLAGAPEEIEVVADAFRTMTARLDEQEQVIKDELDEKTTLLREVHHRVKNNLQLISSIMNIQIRSAKSDEAKHLLSRVQDRVMALSAIHKYLYMSRKLSKVSADQLLSDIIQQLIVVGNIDSPDNPVRIATDFNPVEILPDQSVPLSLLATEAAMNAVKYCDSAAGEDPWINLVLRDVGDDHVCLSVVNSHVQSDETADSDLRKGTGLGSSLIESFVSQLDGTLEKKNLHDRFEVHVTFKLMSENPED